MVYSQESTLLLYASVCMREHVCFAVITFQDVVRISIIYFFVLNLPESLLGAHNVQKV